MMYCKLKGVLKTLKQKMNILHFTNFYMRQLHLFSLLGVPPLYFYLVIWLVTFGLRSNGNIFGQQHCQSEEMVELDALAD